MKSADAFRTISEVAEELDVAQHVLRFWEKRFSQIRPMKRGGGRRYYRPEDMELLKRIKCLLHEEGYTIKGAQRLLKESGGVKAFLEGNMGTSSPAVAPEVERPAPSPGQSADEVSDRAELQVLRTELLEVRALLNS